MESDKYICVRQKYKEQSNLVVVDVAMPSKTTTYPILGDSAIMNPDLDIIALKGEHNYYVVYLVLLQICL